MNVLFLTPDAVGSTLIQRLVTIYMQFHRYDRPVINLHELTNGLVKYYSPEFNRELLGKKQDKWGYYQTLPEVTEMLSGADHYITARLAQYHIQRRQDSVADQVPFYKFLDDNFYIIACRRDNVFEQAISMCFNQITRKLNVYSAEEKIDSFLPFYLDPIELQPEKFLKQLEEYKSYVEWSESNFNISSYFYYDRELENIERYILGLPMFSAQTKIGWKQTFDMEFSEWNRCHFYNSNLGALSNEAVREVPKLLAAPEIKSPGTVVKTNNMVQILPEEQREFLVRNGTKYQNVAESIEQMRRLGILVTGIPIKKQTFVEKQRMVRNLNELKDIYNDWALNNPTICKPVSDESLQASVDREHAIWNPSTALTVSK